MKKQRNSYIPLLNCELLLGVTFVTRTSIWVCQELPKRNCPLLNQYLQIRVIKLHRYKFEFWGMFLLPQQKYFRTSLAIIAFLLILYLGSKVMFLFAPLGAIFKLLLVPMMLSGFMYYLLRPLVRILEKRKLNRAFSILLIYFLIAGLFVLFWILVWPTLQEQIQNFIDNTPYLVQGLQDQFNALRRIRHCHVFSKGTLTSRPVYQNFLAILLPGLPIPCPI